jgi:hypothetical protein
MGDIVIPEEKFEEFLRSLFVRVTKIQEELVAEMQANVELFRAKMNAGYERKVESMIRAVEEDLERKRRAAEDQIEIKLRAAADEIARLRQLERIRHTYEAEREPESRLQ